MSRTNLSDSPTMRRALNEAFGDDPRIDDAEHEQLYPFEDEEGYRIGADRYEAQLAKQWGET